MKTINFKRNKFCGFITVKGQKIFINTRDGTGFHKILEIMEPCIPSLITYGLSFCPWLSKEDIKQDIYVSMLEGIIKYNPDKGFLLAFLYKFVKCRLIDYSRKKDPLKSNFNICLNEEEVFYEILNPIEKIDLIRKIQDWDDKWRRIMFRIFINEDKIADVAGDENITPWGLSRAIRKKLRKKDEGKEC